eukprot:m.68056 g.68056  ORF g.68056 m.68056 type:complete len:190 (-) comp7479_c0_seq1:109-678(-)
MALNPDASMSSQYAQSVMLLIYLKRDYSIDAAPCPLEDMLILIEVIHPHVEDAIERFWITSAIFDMLWHSSDRAELTLLAIRQVTGGRLAPNWAALDATRRERVTELVGRMAETAFAKVLHPAAVIKILDMLVAGCPVIVAFVAAALIMAWLQAGALSDFSAPRDATRSQAIHAQAAELWRAAGCPLKP